MWLPQGARPGQHCPEGGGKPISQHHPPEIRPQQDKCGRRLCTSLCSRNTRNKLHHFRFAVTHESGLSSCLFPQHYGPWNNVPTGQGMFSPSRDSCQASEEMNKPTRGGSLAFSTFCFCSSLILFSSTNGLNIQMTNNENTVSPVTKFLALAKSLGDVPLHA